MGEGWISPGTGPLLCCAAGPCCTTDGWRARELDHRGREGEGGAEVRRAVVKEEQRAAATGDGGSRGGAGPWASASAPVAGERVAEVAGGEGSVGGCHELWCFDSFARQGRCTCTRVSELVKRGHEAAQLSGQSLRARFEGCNRGLTNSVVHTRPSSTTRRKDIGEHDAERLRLSQVSFWLGDIELHTSSNIKNHVGLEFT